MPMEAEIAHQKRTFGSAKVFHKEVVGFCLDGNGDFAY